MNGDGGLEVLVGRQLSDQLIRSVSVYSLVEEELVQLITVNYSKFLTSDLNVDGCREMFVLRPGQTETDRGVAELYRMDGENIERYSEVTMSRPADQLKRILLGKIDGEIPAIYTACAVDETALITDVYIVQDENTCAQLDGQYTVFGQTIEGFEVIDAIANVETNYRDLPLVPVYILSVKKVESQPQESADTTAVADTL
jgi:hypothetical protein